jgi:hypothetical protein
MWHFEIPRDPNRKVVLKLIGNPSEEMGMPSSEYE